MATLWITEYEWGGADKVGQPLPLAREPAVTDQTVTFTSATLSAAFNSNTRFVRLFSSADCHVQFGAAPTATASLQKLAGGVEYWRWVVNGQKVSVYDGTT